MSDMLPVQLHPILQREVRVISDSDSDSDVDDDNDDDDDASYPLFSHTVLKMVDFMIEKRMSKD